MLINSLVHVTVLQSDLNIPSALQNRLYFKFTILKNHVMTALDVVQIITDYKYFNKKTYSTRNIDIQITLKMLLGILGYQSINDHHLGL